MAQQSPNIQTGLNIDTLAGQDSVGNYIYGNVEIAENLTVDGTITGNSSTSTSAVTVTGSIQAAIQTIGTSLTKLGFYGSVGQTQAAAITVPTLTGTYATDYVALQTWMTAVTAVLSGTGLSV
jgi:hypothetical protein